MPEPWDTFKDKAVATLKEALGTLWTNAKDAEAFYQAVASDIAQQAALAVQQADPIKRKVYEDNIEFLVTTAYVRAVKLGLKAANLTEDTAKKVLEVGLSVLAGLLKRVMVIP
jgi:hypothetical protein